MQVECIDSSWGVVGLTDGKIYDIMPPPHGVSIGHVIYVINDNGKRRGYSERRFRYLLDLKTPFDCKDVYNPVDGDIVG